MENAINVCLLLIVGIVFIFAFLKKTKYDNMEEDYYNYTTAELLNLKNEKWNEYDFATYTERFQIMREIEQINEELENRNL